MQNFNMKAYINLYQILKFCFPALFVHQCDIYFVKSSDKIQIENNADSVDYD